MKNDTVMNIALPTELKKKLQETAKAKNISLNSLVRLILTENLKKEEK